MFLYCCVFLKLYKHGNIMNNFSHNHYLLGAELAASEQAVH
jgi:hypothetical protein